MPSYPYLTNGPRNGYTMSAREMIRRIFGHEDYGTKVPADVEANWTNVDGVQVAYLSTAAAKQFWGGPNPKGMYMRAIAVCPCCERPVAASRINQHAKIHRKEA